MIKRKLSALDKHMDRLNSLNSSQNTGNQLGKYEIHDAANYGFYGSVLMFLGFIPFIGGFLLFIGFILILIALNDFSKIFNNKYIFENALYAVVAGIIISILVITVAPLGIFSGHITSTIIVVFILIYIASITSGYFYRNVYSSLADNIKNNLGNISNEEFQKASSWYWYGGLTTIILIGVIFILIADIYALLGYRELSKTY
ncbi:putative membrane protein [Caldisphaera lagunensis DSM 15908]|uniref:Putative membrane protein n=1 Tax=Caldisphaera lagunensis (strain DSM 15908 / JCM 11604 / ANMR 0165 / IC-154) TaxID=1056495 RepID=L0A7X9_CALLD|nr:DUF996 domain-containing protein [Caldisphaera lagunensis]AFZ69978.1 putative membrane protein [Caldisphaera lagunensis DSM 15908]